jgi:hypothetical protein
MDTEATGVLFNRSHVKIYHLFFLWTLGLRFQLCRNQDPTVVPRLSGIHFCSSSIKIWDVMSKGNTPAANCNNFDSLVGFNSIRKEPWVGSYDSREKITCGQTGIFG